ncbi:MAG: hypothetical protein ACRDM7_14390 [Thermoleophilaceae bacterium]
MTSRRLILAGLLACALLAAGCGGEDGEQGADRPPPEARPDQFPSAKGKTLVELYDELPQGGPVLAPSLDHFVAGRNRYAFGLFTAARAQIADAAAAVYVAPAGGGEARGPFVARYESLEVATQFRSQSSAADEDAAKTLYVTDLPLPRPGKYEVLGMALLDGRLVAAVSARPTITVRSEDLVPRVGERPPRIHTLTEADVGGDLEQIDTRVPPSSQHESDFADVVGKEPVVLTFATPRLCQSRVCGPVVDVVEQVKADYEDEAEFIHMEVYNGNEIRKGYRPQLEAFRLPTEPWVFTISSGGRIAARLEGAFSAQELEAAVKKAVG